MSRISTNFSIPTPYVKIGAIRNGLVGCKGCVREFYSCNSFPCNLCTHNIKMKNNTTAKNYYETKK